MAKPDVESPLFLTDQTSGTQARSKRKQVKEKFGGTCRYQYISLQRIVLDAHEYHGFTALAWHALFFICANLALFYMWENTAAAFKSAVVTSLASFDPGKDWETSEFRKVDSVEEGVDYFSEYLTIYGRRSKELHLVNESIIHIGEHAQITYARLRLNIEGNCEPTYSFPIHKARGSTDAHRYASTITKWVIERIQKNKTLSGKEKRDIGQQYTTASINECWRRTDNYSEMANGTSKFWQETRRVLREEEGGEEAPAPEEVVIIWDPSWLMVKNEATSQWELGNTSLLPSKLWEKRGERERETGSYVVELLKPWNFSDPLQRQAMSDQTARSPLDVMLSRLRKIVEEDRQFIGRFGYSLSLEMFAESRIGADAAVFQSRVKLHNENKELRHSTTTQHVRTEMQKAGEIFTILLGLFALTYVIHDIGRFTMASLQADSVWVFFRYGWNVLSIISNLSTMAWVLMYPVMDNQLEKSKWPRNNDSFDTIEHVSENFTLYQYTGIFVVLSTGTHLLRGMRVHLGVKAFYQVFFDAGHMMADFIVFVMYILLVLGSTMFAFFQITGGNPDFTNWTDGLSAMARLPFGFYEWKEFYNDAAGLGVRYSWTIQLLFWVAVLFLIIFTQNTLLAIFATAYDEARQKTLRVDLHFLPTVVLRIVFSLMRAWNNVKRFLVLLSKKSIIREARHHWAVSRTIDKNNSDYRSQGLDLVDFRELYPAEAPAYSFITRVWRYMVYQYHEYKYQISRHIVRRKRMFDHQGHGKVLSQRPPRLLFSRWYVVRCPEFQSLAALYLDMSTMKLQEYPTWHFLRSRTMNIQTRAIPPQKSLLTIEEFRELLELMLEKKKQLDQRGSISGYVLRALNLIGFGNPFLVDPDAFTKTYLLEAVQDVYTFMDRPITDAAYAEDEIQEATEGEVTMDPQGALREEVQQLKREMEILRKELLQALRERH